MGLPLEGIRVVEFVHMVMGPTCGLVLADLGAEVIKVEPLPAGDNTRRLTGSGAGFFPTYNRNKKSFAVDVKSPEGRELVLKLLARADVVTENFRPGAMAKLGLDYESLQPRLPRLVYCSLKGFLKGPYENRTALDEVVQMMGGLAYMTGPPGRPLRAGASVNDVMGGMFAAIGIMGALMQRAQTGRGQAVTAGLFETCVFLVGQHMAQYAVTGAPARPMPVRLSAWAIYDVFATKDGEQVFVGIVTDTQWAAFCDAVGRADLRDDPAFSTNKQRVHARDRLLPIVTALFGAMTEVELTVLCERVGLPFAPIVKPEELFDDPHLAASGGLVETELPGGARTSLPALPLALGGQRLPKRLDVPACGEQTREVLEALGYAPSEIERLARAGAIGLGERP